ncbi:hypothetical protein [Brevibacterium linens]|uniref:Uncharacterized protein n=1 Tax=Brevibacterium linens TaxID=1703 RepID=A0A2H1KGS4_BRELN|nr:hypothetical protein [Brevibacterium linens]SMX98849.1 hypothetical protein BLIN101_03328 [Brevibacterium linens]
MAIPTVFPVKYKCGHTEKRDLSRVAPSKRKSLAESDFFATKAGKNDDGLVCKKCFNAERENDTEAFLKQLMLDTEAFEAEHGLPELTGTDKQISSGLVESARKDRFTVLDTIANDEEYADQFPTVLEAAQTLTWGGWWTNNLGFKTRKDNEYGPEEFVELIIDGAEEEAKRAPSARAEPENPHDWNPNEAQ